MAIKTTKTSGMIYTVKEMKSTQPAMVEDSVLVPTKLIHGQYANRLLCSFCEKEYILDFASILPGVETPRVNARVVVSKDYMKSFIDAMIATYDSINNVKYFNGKQTTNKSSK